MLTKKLMLASAVALVAAGLTAPAAPAYVLDPGGERLIVSMTSRTSHGLAKPKATAAKPQSRPKPPLEP